MELTPELTPFLFGIYKLVKYALYPLSWVLLLMSLTTVLLLLPMTPRRLRWARIGSTGGLILLFMISSPVIARPLLGSLEAWHATPLLKGARYDAIVVLAGGLLQPGTLRPTAERSRATATSRSDSARASSPDPQARVSRASSPPITTRTRARATTNVPAR